MSGVSQALFSAVSDMEGHVRDVRGYAQVLVAMGEASSHCHPKALSVLGDALHDLAARLEDEFEVAFRLAAETKP